MKIHQSYEAVVLVQYLLSYLALISLYKSSIRLFNLPWAALITGLYFLGFYMIQFWNLFLYAESLLISMTCFSLYYLIKWDKHVLRKWETPIMVLVIGLTFFTKPTGVAILAAMTAVLMKTIWEKIEMQKIKVVFTSLVLVSGLVLLNQMLSTFGFVNDYLSGEIVYNISNVSDQDYAKYLIMEKPDDLWLPNENHPTLIRFASLILFNPYYSIKLIGTKLFYFLFYVRPYYSWIHNMMALAVLVPMYVFFVKEIIQGEISVNLKLFASVYLLVSISSTVLLTVDWHSRFLMPVLPLIFLIGGMGISRLVMVIWNYNKTFSLK